MVQPDRCPRCGGTLAHDADGRHSDTVHNEMVRCASCGQRYLVTITVTPINQLVRIDTDSEVA